MLSPGTRIGPARILRHLGENLFGDAYEVVGEAGKGKGAMARKGKPSRYDSDSEESISGRSRSVRQRGHMSPEEVRFHLKIHLSLEVL